MLDHPQLYPSIPLFSMNVHKIISKSSNKNDEAHTEMINPTSYNDAGADTPKHKISITVPQK